MQNKRTHIVVVGSTNTDLVVRTPNLPAPGETVLGGTFSVVSGGKGANQAVAAARMGGKVSLIARIGDDDFGRRSAAGFTQDGIDTTYLFVTPNAASGVALIAVSETTGENSIVVAPGANALLSPEDVQAAEAAFDTARAVVLSLEVPLETIQRAAEMGAKRQIPVILNPAPARRLPARLLSLISVLTPNETEARQIVGMGAANEEADLETIATELLMQGVDTAVITLGAAGALIVTPDGIERAPALAVKAVDTVGAGDCFTGALAVELASGRSLRDAVQFAGAAAALKVTRLGAQTGIPARSEVEELLARR
ncbi:MAG: ribokinase [Cytophagales bacterium]|nr:ribokinase [Armatimonadota bacterium]